MDTIPEKLIRLKEKLDNPLPGMDAQKLMAPKISDPHRFNLEKKKMARPGAVMLLLYPGAAGELHIPFMRRTEYKGAHSGQISLPGGKYEKEDQNLEETAIRESFEEMGIQRDRIQKLGRLTDLFVTVSNFNINPFVFYSHEKPDFIPEVEEVAEIIESPVDRLLKPESIKETTIKISGSFSIRTPYYDLDGKVLWGATAMIMSEFLSIYRSV